MKTSLTLLLLGFSLSSWATCKQGTLHVEVLSDPKNPLPPTVAKFLAEKKVAYLETKLKVAPEKTVEDKTTMSELCEGHYHYLTFTTKDKKLAEKITKLVPEVQKAGHKFIVDKDVDLDCEDEGNNLMKKLRGPTKEEEELLDKKIRELTQKPLKGPSKKDEEELDKLIKKLK